MVAVTVASFVMMPAASAQVVVNQSGSNGSDGASYPVLGFGDPGTGGTAGSSASYINGTVNISATSVDEAGIYVVSNGGKGGRGGNGPGVAGLGGDGGDGNNGGTVTVNISGTIVTTGDNVHGILAESNGGDGGNGGNGAGLDGEGGDGGTGGNGGVVSVTVGSGTINTSGTFANGIFAQSRGGVGGDGGSGDGLDGSGGDGAGTGPGNNVTVVNSADITTGGDSAHGILAQSIGGFGGSGGDSGGIVGYGASGKSAGDGGTVSVTNHGTIVTNGNNAYGIFAQSVGGGGGAGGSGSGIVGLGASGSAGGAGGTVTVVNTGDITTSGEGSYGILAQSVGGGGGDGGDSGGLVSIGGGGSGTSTASGVTVTNSGTIQTSGDSAHAILAQSVGGGGGNGGSSGGIVSIGGSGGSGGTGGTVDVTNTGNLSTTGDDSTALFAQSVGGGGGNGGGSIGVGAFVSVAIGGSGDGGGDADNVTINGNNDANTAQATITTTGDRSHGIFGQSIGGGGGSGGYATSVAVGSTFSASVAIGGNGADGGDGKNVFVGSNGTISTTGEDSMGVFAQSVGGGGGNGGTSVAISASTGASLSVSLGGGAGGGGSAGTVDVNSFTNITTEGSRSHGIQAQSVGGGGGNGGLSVSVAVGSTHSGAIGLGGSGGAGGTGDNVTVNSVGNIGTKGDYSNSIFAQSVGGGGGFGGNSIAVGAGGATGLGVALGGSGGAGQNAGDVEVNSTGALSTEGASSHGILAQSIGGGGGSGGYAIGVGINTGGAGLSLGVGGSGSGGGNSGEVDVTNNGNITTKSDLSSGIYAQSVGGGGGDGGFAVAGSAGQFAASVAVGGSGDGGGTADDVTVDSTGNIITEGDKSRGIFAQSVGGGGGDGGMAVSLALAASEQKTGAISVAVGGGSGSGNTAGEVQVTSDGSIHTKGIESHGIQAQSIGGGGGNGGIAGSLSANFSGGVSVAVSVGGAGADGASGDKVSVTSGSANTNTSITTEGDAAYGIYAQSVGGGGGDGGGAMSLTLGGGDKSLNASVAIGGPGGTGSSGSTVDVTNFSHITTGGENSHAIFAQSIGGGGGNGGFAVAGSIVLADKAVSIPIAIGGLGGNGNTGDDVTIDNSGNIITTGEGSVGIFAQSIGGAGGNGGMSIAGSINIGDQPKNIAVTVGGFGGVGNSAGKVDVTNSGTITTSGTESYGILAQSIGGSGGNGGFAFSGGVGSQQAMNLTVAVGGSAGSGGLGGEVVVDNSGAIMTSGEGAHGIFVQSIGGGGGTGGSAAAYGAGLTADNKYTLQASVAVGGGGGSGNLGGTVDVTNSGAVTTTGNNAYALLAQSIGGGGGTGGTSYTGNLVGDFANDGKQISVAVAVGGSGGDGNHGGKVTVDNSGALSTSGTQSHGLYAHSIGGGGGAGGGANAVNVVVSPDNFNPYKAKDNNTPDFKSWTVEVAVGGSGGSAGDGNEVNITNSGAITTTGDYSAGIYAQSIGGGGGDGGTGAFGSGDPTGHTDAAIAIATCLPCNLPNIVGLTDISIIVGGSGGTQGDGGKVIVNNSGNISTSGSTSHGILAQSIGGGGGTAYAYAQDSDLEASAYGGNAAIGPNGKLGVSGAGGAAGDADDVTVTNTANITTSGNESNGIFVQSIGGGGGIAGNIDRTLPAYIGAAAEVVGLENIGLGIGFGQDGGDGGNGGNVVITNSGNISTSGSTAYGIFAQSVGGGGGTSGDMGRGIVPNLILTSFAGSVGKRGDAGDVTITHSGSIVTTGKASHGIFAQSAGGTAGTGSNGSSGTVAVTVNGTVNVTGEQSIGVLAQSVAGETNGNINITVGSAGSIVGGSGTVAEDVNFAGVGSDKQEAQAIGDISVGVLFMDGATNTLDNAGLITTQNGVAGMAVGGTVGDETINNTGTLTGSIDLGDGVNAINNQSAGTLNSGTRLNLGSDTALVTNDGSWTPGGTGNVMTTELTGSVQQNSGGSYGVDLDFARTGLDGEADRINASGTANLSGSVDLDYLNIPLLLPGDHEVTILSADGGTTNNGLTLNAVQSAVASFELLYPNPNDVVLGYSIDFAPDDGLNRNQTAIGEHINDIQLAGSDPSLANLITALFYLPEVEDLAHAYDELSPETYANTQVATLFAGLSFADNMKSCSRGSGATAHKVDRNKCVWLKGQGRWLDRDGTSQHIAFDEETSMISGGAHFALNRNWQFGVAAGYELSRMSTATWDETSGRRAHGGLVLKYKPGNFELAAAVTGGYGWYETHRQILFPGFEEYAQSEHNVSYINGRLSASYTFKEGSLYIKPSAELNVTHINLEGFVETGAGGVNLAVNSQESTVFSFSSSLEIGKEIKLEDGTIIKPYLRAGATIFDDNALSVSASFAGAPDGVPSFSVDSEYDRVFADVQAGINLIGTDDSSISLDYKGRFSEDTEEHTGGIRAKIKF